MSNLINVEQAVESAALLAALDAFLAGVHRHLKPQLKITADNVAAEAGRRIRRKTGLTGDAITVEETHNGDGYVVFVGGSRTHIGRFLEFGTKHQQASPFLFPAAALEAGALDRRAREALQAAIDEQGLGDA
jgi:HK97 gp10 family phage protein